MRIRDEITKDDLAVARLASAFTLLALAPYDAWGHEGDPAEMAAYVVASARKDGRLGHVWDVLGITGPTERRNQTVPPR